MTAQGHPRAVFNRAIERGNLNNRIAASVGRSWLCSAPYTSTDAAGNKTALDRRRCVELLVPYIERLDREGYERFDTTRLAYAFGDPDQPVARELFELGIMGGSSYKPSNPDDEPAIWLQVGSGGTYGSGSVTRALEKAAADAGNQAKLAACPFASCPRWSRGGRRRRRRPT